MGSFTPPTIAPPLKPLGIIGSLRAMRKNALNIVPDIAYTQPIVTGKTGFSRWHMVQGPEALKQIFLDNVENYPKSEVVIRMLRPAVGESLFTSEGSNWRWQRRAISPVFTVRNVTALAPLMTKTAERTTTRIETHLKSHPELDPQKIEHWLIGHACELAQASHIDLLGIRENTKKSGELLKRNGIEAMTNWLGSLN